MLGVVTPGAYRPTGHPSFMTSPSSTDHGLHLQLLGGFDARLNGQPVAGLYYGKMRALLAYLAVERERDHKREVLAELLWSGNDPTTARGNLRRTLADLRRVLELPAGPVLFSTTKQTIRFVSNGRVDVFDFIRSTPDLPEYNAAAEPPEERRIALYRGKFLADLSLPDCPVFQDWLQLKRETLHRRALAALEKLANRHEEAGDYHRALPFAVRHAELEPCEEKAQRRVMRLHALNGKRDAALSQYEVCCTVLKQERGILPSEETWQLAQRIRQGELQADRSEGALASSPQDMAQRRQVTVLYCELTPACGDDPDEMVDVLQAPQARCMEHIRQFSGHVVQTHGGGLLAYFGFPQACEDAARRAVQAALAVTRDAVPGIEIRAGIHTGLIVTNAALSVPDACGQTSMVAIRLRDSASANEVVISLETLDLVAGYFDCARLGSQQLPGREVELFRVTGASGARTRLDAAAQLTPLIGRQDEMVDLMELWQQCTSGVRHVVLVRGEAGMGKSRLLHALKERLARQPHALRELRCFPEFAQSPFYPLMVMLEGLFGFASGEAPQARFGKLVAYMNTLYPKVAKNIIPLLAQLFSLPLAAPYAASALPAQKQKEQMLAILLDLLHALAARQPTLLVVEDLHWVDPSTLELLTLFVKQTTPCSILTVLTARPEFVAPWPQALTTTLTLHPLKKDEVADMVAAISADIAPKAIQGIVERADGVPLFVEEMAKITALDQQARIPATLHDLLAARMDKLGAAKHTAQLAAMLGREFDLALLRKIHPASSEELATHLSALHKAGLILRVSDNTSQFKHALIQEAAYQSQVKTDRQAAHHRVAQVLHNDFTELIANQPEVLAQHLSAAGETWSAIEYWLKAGQRAAQRSGNQEAIGHFNAALKLVEALPVGQNRDTTEFKIFVSLCPVLYSAKGHGSQEASQANARIAVLCERVGDSPELFQAKWALVINTLTVVGTHKCDVLKSARQLLSMAHDDPLRQQVAHYVVANAAYWMGDFETTCAHAKQALALYRPEQSQVLLERFNQDQSGPSAYLSWALYLLGFPDQAQQVCEHMLMQARARSDRPQTLASALSFALALYRWMGKSAETLSLSVETISMARQHDLSVWLTVGEMSHGWTKVMHGQADGIVELKSSIARMRQAMGGISVAFLAPLAEAYVHLHQYDEALALLADAQADARRSGDGHFIAELHRLKGVCLLGTSAANATQAESCFDHALAVSRQQRAKSLELRAAMSMARLWQTQGKSAQARRLLEDVYKGFTEGLDTPDLQAAAALLLRLN